MRHRQAMNPPHSGVSLSTMDEHDQGQSVGKGPGQAYDDPARPGGSPTRAAESRAGVGATRSISRSVIRTLRQVPLAVDQAG